MALASKPGEFEYSNLGYIMADAIAESRTGKTWEDLIREQIFAPLGITSAVLVHWARRVSLTSPAVIERLLAH